MMSLVFFALVAVSNVSLTNQQASTTKAIDGAPTPTYCPNGTPCAL